MDTTLRCFDCRVDAPETTSEYTLISGEGWRLSRLAQPDGSFALEWRCPTCWKKYKERTGTTSGPIPRVTRVLDPPSSRPGSGAYAAVSPDSVRPPQSSKR
jgi:hypothetical protein